MAGFVGLPVELVQIISGCMTLRDWARASGTCKAWWKLPLIKLELCKAAGHESKLTSAGIKWVSKHGHSVQLLVLDLENLAVNSLGELQPLSEIFVGRGINELHLLGSVTTPSLKIPVATTPTHPMGTGQLSRKLFHYIMRYAAAMATALRVLQCHLEYLDPNHGFPVMRHLEHVVLRVASLHLPSSCTVHLDPMSWELACAPVWASLHSVGFLFYDQEGRATPEAHGDRNNQATGIHSQWMIAK
ncbi:g8518 [Coccomyxa elongata]